MRLLALVLSSVVFSNPLSAADWSGFYVGAHASAAFGQAEGSLSGSGVSADLGKTDADGIGGGGHFGFGRQFGRLYAGLEADATALDAGSKYSASSSSVTVTQTASLDFTSSLRARLGYASESFLIYATGGIAVGRFAYDVTGNVGGLTLSFGDEKVAGGAVVGGGIEWAFSDSMAFRAEALHYMFSDVDLTTAGGYTLRVDTDETLVRFGFTYKPQ